PAKVSTGETLATPQNLDEPAVAALLAPPQAENTSQGGAERSEAKKWRGGGDPPGANPDLRDVNHGRAAQAGADHGRGEVDGEVGSVEVIWQGPQKEDERSQQIQLVQNAIASRVDGIVLAPLDSRALVKPVEEAVEKGIPVVIIDSGLESNKIVSYIATDN